VLWVAHLGDEDKEHEMPCVSEDGVRDADEGGDEVRLHRYAEVARSGGVEACAYHSNNAGNDDGKNGGDGEPGEAVEGAREGAKEGGDCEDAGVEH